jgi:hypothetical protein
MACAELSRLGDWRNPPKTAAQKRDLILKLDGKVMGLVSWGISCGLPEYPGVYARISTVSDWIDENRQASSLVV